MFIQVSDCEACNQMPCDNLYSKIRQLGNCCLAKY